MEQKTKFTCFVISPIGEKNSETRKRSDKLIEYIIEPALDKDKYEIIRADSSDEVTPITNHIISLIQQSDLCIIDLTDNNPYVMYEFGRRQETGKPFILLTAAESKSKLPFDISGIRTIFYDINDVESVNSCMRKIKSIVYYFEKSEFSLEYSGESLSSIAEKLSRIERLIQSMPKTANITTPAADDSYPGLTPNQQFILALQENNIPAAESLLPYFETTKPQDVFYDQFLEVLARKGSHVALNRLIQDIDYIDSLPEKRKVEAISYICIGFQATDREKEGLEVMSDIIDRSIESCKDKKNKATILNQKGRLITDSKERIKLLLKVIELDPFDPAFYFNLSVCYENIGDLVPV